MDDVQTLRQELKALLVNRLRLRGTDPTSIADDEPLLKGSLGLDSIDVLELVLAVEQAYSVKVSDEQLEQGAFHSIAALAEFVRGQAAGTA
jgi:acyl carrier protein